MAVRQDHAGRPHEYTVKAWRPDLAATFEAFCQYILDEGTMQRVRQDGVEVSTRVVSVFHYIGGKQLERWFSPDDPAALDTLFADGA